MKKITIVLIALVLAAGVAVAKDVIVSVSGTASVEWGFKGQLIDNTGKFMDAAVPSGDFYSDGGDLNWDKYPSFKLTGTVKDADGKVIVEAASKSKKIQISDYPTVATFDDKDGSTKIVDLDLDYIKFPNVVPGLLGITLKGPGALEPAYQPSGSTSSNERILIDVTPIDQLAATLGLLIKTDNKLKTRWYSPLGTVPTTGTFVWADDEDADDFDESGSAAITNPWEAGTYLSFAASLEAKFTQKIGEKDSISVGLGAVYDTAFFNGVYEPDYLVEGFPGYDKYYSKFGEGADLNAAGTQALITEVYGPIAVNALSMKEQMPSQFGSTDDAKMKRTNEVFGRTTIPLGVGITASVAGLSAAVDFQTVLAEGNAADNYTGVLDLIDVTKSTANFASYAMPMYAAVDVGYSLPVGDMTITPKLNFKYCSDFWKWTLDTNPGIDADNDGYYWDYLGDVSPADYIGRPMSLKAGVDVKKIAGIIDVAVSANLGFGDAPANHGFGFISGDPLGIAASMVGMTKPSYTVTHDEGVPQTAVFGNTLAELIDFYYIQPTLAGSATNFYNQDTDHKANSATDGLNNGYFASGTTAMGVSLGITVTPPITGLTIANTTAYSLDNTGIGMGKDKDNVVLFGVGLSTLKNTTDVTYKVMAGEAVAFTIFGNFIYKSVSYQTEKGKAYAGLRADDEDVAPDIYFFEYSEAPSMATFDYKVGVKASVSLQ